MRLGAWSGASLNSLKAFEAEFWVKAKALRSRCNDGSFTVNVARSGVRRTSTNVSQFYLHSIQIIVTIGERVSYKEQEN